MSSLQLQNWKLEAELEMRLLLFFGQRVTCTTVCYIRTATYPNQSKI